MRILKQKDFLRILDSACSDWYWNKFSDEDSIEVKESEYKLMRKACTTDQHELFDEIFGKDQPEINFQLNNWYCKEWYDGDRDVFLLDEQKGDEYSATHYSRKSSEQNWEALTDSTYR